MFVERIGTGARAVIGIHGWAGNHHTWRRLSPYVPRDTTFHALDLPGYGESKTARFPSLDGVIDAISEYVSEIDSDDVTLLGNCGGALLAIEVARKLANQKVQRVVMLDPFGYPPLYFRVFLWGAFGRCAYHTTFANPIGRWLTNGALARKRAESTDLTKGFRDVDHVLALHYLRLMHPLANARRYDGVACAIDIAYGERTFHAVRRSLPLWQQALPQAQYNELRGAGHEPVKEATEQVAALTFREVAATQLVLPAAAGIAR